VTAGVTTSKFIEPPADSTQEWLIKALHLSDTSNIDATDTITVYYKDEVSAKTLRLAQARLNAFFINNIFTWPTMVSGTAITMVYPLDTPILTKRQANGDSYLRIGVDYGATATVGTRNPQLRWLYMPREVLSG